MNVTKGLLRGIIGKTIMVTGGTGSFGHYIVAELLKYDVHRIIVFSRDENKQYEMEMQYKRDKLTFAPGDVFTVDEEDQFRTRNACREDRLVFALGDVRDLDRVMEVTRNVDIIYHAAALKQVPYCEFHPYEAVKTNIVGAHNIKTAAIKNAVEKVIGISTDKAVKPVNAMGMSKALQEKIFLSEEEMHYDTKFAIVRYGNVLGSRGSVIPAFKERILRKQPLNITHEDMTRFIITLKQAIELVLYATSKTEKREIFVRKAPACSIMDLAKVMSQALTGGTNYSIVKVGIRPGEKIHEVLVSEEEMFRTKEFEDYFVIYPYGEYLKMKNGGNLDFFRRSSNIKEYSSESTRRLSKEEILSLLKSTGWV